MKDLTVKPTKIEIQGGCIYLRYEDKTSNVSRETKVLHNKEYKHQRTAMNAALKLLSDKEYSFIGMGKSWRNEKYYSALIIRRSGNDRYFTIGLKKKLLRTFFYPQFPARTKPTWEHDLNDKEKELLKKYLGDFVTAEEYEDGAFGIYK
jgi:hypothetical protein